MQKTSCSTCQRQADRLTSAAEHPSEKIGEEIRKLYSWSDEDKLINN